jgi:protein KTI12
MEVPNPKNRWDKPLFHLRPGEDLPLTEIEQAILHGKVPRPPKSTAKQVTMGGDYVQQVDRATQAVIEGILELQVDRPEGS